MEAEASGEGRDGGASSSPERAVAGRGPRGARPGVRRGPARVVRPSSGRRWDTWLRDVTAFLAALAALITVGVGLYREIRSTTPVAASSSAPVAAPTPAASPRTDPAGRAGATAPAGVTAPTGPTASAAPVQTVIFPGPDSVPATVRPPQGHGPRPPARNDPVIPAPDDTGAAVATPVAAPTSAVAVTPARPGSCRWQVTWPYVGIFGSPRGNNVWMVKAPHVFTGDCRSVEGVAPNAPGEVEFYYRVDADGTNPAGYVRDGSVHRLTTEAADAEPAVP